MKDKFTNHEAEMSVIGAALLDTEYAMSKAYPLTANDFTDQKHRHAWEAILHLHKNNDPVDLVSLTTVLKKNGTLEKAGGSSYLADLVDFVPTAANVGYYVKQLQECTKRRQLEQIGRQIPSMASESETAAEALDRVEAALMALRVGSQGENKAETAGNLAGKVIAELEDQSGDTRQGVPSGLYDLDRLTNGFQPGDMIVIGGRPSMGKTALAMDVVQDAASNNYNVLVFSLEMTKEQLTKRLLSKMAKVPGDRIRKKTFQGDDLARLKAAHDDLLKMPLKIDARFDITTLDIRAAARREHRNRPLDLIVIDYLQLMRPVKAHSVREREVAEMSRSLKALAIELDVPVVVLAQLNRSGETGGKIRKPIPSDLRESGSLEQDADLILFPWREAATCVECKREDCGKGHFNRAEIIVAKQRNGPKGTVDAIWLGDFTTFENLLSDINY